MTDPRIAQETELVEWLCEAVGEVLERPADEVDPEVPLTELGLSSRDGVGLVGELEDHLDRDIDPTIVFETPTISLLAHRLVYGDDAPLNPDQVALATGAVADSIGPDDDAVAIVGIGCP